MTRHYTKAPEPSNEDFQLPWFLRSDEKYVELMAAVASMLDAFPESINRKHWERLVEAYSQITYGPHKYESVPDKAHYTYLGMDFRPIPSGCLWCSKDSISHQ